MLKKGKINFVKLEPSHEGTIVLFNLLNVANKLPRTVVKRIPVFLID